MSTNEHLQVAPEPDKALENEHQVASAPRRNPIVLERIWAGRLVNKLVSDGMAPVAACRVIIDQLEVADHDEGDSTQEFLDWAFGDNPAELERWHRLVNLVERPNWRIEGF